MLEKKVLKWDRKLSIQNQRNCQKSFVYVRKKIELKWDRFFRKKEFFFYKDLIGEINAASYPKI